ncbi:unnamed protein product [Sympodiomycopsis kandeliae]
MPAPHPFSECSQLQSVFYRRRELYSLAWAHSAQDIGDFLLASAPNGGFLALTRDPRRLVTLGKTSILKPKILVYTAAGQLVESIPWDPSNRIVGLGFTTDERLIVVLDEGVVRVYSLLAPCPSTSQNAATDPSTSSSSSIASGPFPATATCYYHQYSLGADATETGVVEGKCWAQGVVALTGAGRFVDFRIPHQQAADQQGLWEEYAAPPTPQILPAPVVSGMSSNAGPIIPTAWTFIPPTSSSSGLLEVLLSPPAISPPQPRPSNSGTDTGGRSTPQSIQSVSGGTVISLDSVSGSTDMRLNRGPFSSILASPNGKLLSLLTADKVLWVVSSDFQRSLSEFDVTNCEAYKEAQNRSTSADLGGLGNTGIHQIEWCGNNTVALAWETEVVMVGPFGESLRYYYPSSIHLASEIDGVRIIGTEKMEFIQKVANSTSAIFRPGSSDPAALLYDASENFAHRSAKADEGIRAIKNDLAGAVDVCIDAASQEWDVVWQRRLLKAASLGKSFLDSKFDPNGFVEMSQKCRVLNNVRSYEIGIPLSYEQFQAMGATALIDRLTNRNHHLLSLRIASHLRLRPDGILRHWARAKIARSSGNLLAASAKKKAQEDDELCDIIVRKFQGLDEAISVSYSSIASSAFRAGRVRLATKLLDHEPRAVDQVPLLLRMGEDRLALQKSVESGDTDLIYHVLLRLKNQLSRGDFFRIVQAPGLPKGKKTTTYQQLASRLLEVYAYQYDQELLKDLYFTDDRRVEASLLLLAEAHNSLKKYNTKPEDDGQLSEISIKLKDSSKLFSEDKDRTLESKLVSESTKLLTFQSICAKEDHTKKSWIGRSLNETIKQCFVLGSGGSGSNSWVKKAEKLKADFKVSEGRFATLKVDALIQLRNWDTIWNTYGNVKKPPAMGYEPLIVKLLKAKADQEALKYVTKVMTIGDKTDKNKLNALIPRLPPNVAVAFQNQMEERT